jgi:hypothetical protein
VLGGVVVCRVADGNIAGLDGDSSERVNSFSSSGSRSSSSLFRHCLDFLAGGGCVSGEGGVGGAGGSVGRAGGVEQAVATAATAAGGNDCAGSSCTAVAARLYLRLWRWRQRRLPAAVSVAAGPGTLQVTVRA